jgi:chemosensory pili system protein ChpA (sensor histidine kinase/response regulator)
MVSARPNFNAGLHWVRPEIERSLGRARQIIEARVDDEDESADLGKALVELKQIVGTSEMIQCVGINAVAREMCATLEALNAGWVADSQATGSALLGAVVQLLDYMDALSTGLPDQALIFQPVINELRVARGESLITEADLFASQLLASDALLPHPGPLAGAAAATEAARRYQPVFQQALAVWLRDAGGREPVARLGKVAEVVANGASEARVHELWRLVAAVAEGWLSGGIDDSLDLKRLIGRTARNMQLLAEGDEVGAARDARSVSAPLVWHVGRARLGGARIQAVRDGLGLAERLPSDEALSAARSRLRGANTALLNQLSHELRSDLQEVKDAIDLVVRAGARAATDLSDSRERLDRISNTLAMLGLPVHARVARNQMSLIATLESEDAEASHGGWLDAAAALLRIESSLDEALFRQLSRPGLSPDESPTADEIPNTADLMSGAGALVRESLVNLSRVKTAVDAWLRSGDEGQLGDAVPLLREVAAALRVGAHERAGGMVDALADFTADTDTQNGFATLRERRDQADRYADAVATVEYHLEALAERRPDADDLLDAVAVAIDGLAPVAGASDAVTSAAPAERLATVVDEDSVDPVIREVFLEEAAEVLETLNRELDRWRRDPGNTEAMLEIRRGFHTLKGSGRMVGATEIGEYAWACEKLLNQCRDGELEVTPPILAFTESAISGLPELIEAFRDGRSPEGAASDIAAHAQRTATGDEATHQDGELLQVFTEDARAQLEAVEGWLNEAADDARADAELVRIFHTLRGSAAAVSKERISSVAGATEAWLNAVRGANWILDAGPRTLLRDITDALRTGLDDGADIDVDSLLQRIHSQQETLPLEAREAAADKALSDTFALEALDLLQSIEATAGSWREQPESHWYARTLQSLFQSLRGAAVSAQCAAIGQVALAFEGRMTAFSRDGEVPPPPFFADLAELIEGIYQQLDAFREGQLDDDGSVLAARVFQLRAESPEAEEAAAEAVPMFGSDEEAPQTAEDHDDAADEAIDPELIEIFQSEAQELLEVIDQNLDAAERAPDARAPMQELARALHTLKGSARMAGFNDIGEVAHRFESRLGRAENGEITADHAFYARLHNVTDGLYRVIDAIRIGESPQLEPLFADLEDDGTTPMPTTAGPETESEALRETESEPEALLDLSGFDADAEDKLELGGADALAAAPEDGDGERLAFDISFAEDDGVISGEPLRLDAPLESETPESAAPTPAPDFEGPEADSIRFELDDEADAAPEPFEPKATDDELLEKALETSAPIPARDADPDFDAELLEVFREEATELLELLSDGLHRWHAAPDGAGDAVGDVQRALHTLKGGARMAGMEAMASAAHEMESLVEELVLGHVPADDLAFAQLETRLDQLQSMHDQLRRGVVVDEDESQFFDADLLDEVMATGAEATERRVEDERLDAEHLEWTADPAVPAAESLDPSTPDDVGTELDVPPPIAVDADDAVAVGEEGATTWSARVFWRPPSEDEGLLGLRRELARVPVERLETMLNEAGEISILRSRLDQQIAAQEQQLAEVGETVERLRDQLRQMGMETEAQIAARGLHQGPEGSHRDPDRYGQDFDPLEMDRYSRMQELSRALSESVNDLSTLHASMHAAISETEALLLQQQRITSEVQQGLMGTLMVPFSRQAQRLQRVARQVATETGKRVDVVLDGIGVEVDRNVLERMTAPLEHVLRNAVVHGIESPDDRQAAGKPETGTIRISLTRDGQNLRLEVADDGRGLNYAAIREAAVQRGLMNPELQLSDAQVALFILEPGFSTASELTQSAGRGVGMDVVASEVRQLGGSLELDSEAGRGARFIIRLPITLGLTQALMVSVGQDPYAVPLSGIEGIARVSRAQAQAGGLMEYGGNAYEIAWLADFLGRPRGDDPDARTLSAILVRLPEGLSGSSRNMALLVDRLLGNREVVSKSLGPTVSSIAGMAGATILPDGRIVLLLDVAALIQDRIRRRVLSEVPAHEVDAKSTLATVMVIDDSITMRRVAERLLKRNGYGVSMAKDGLDGMAALTNEVPDVVLLDIEMPRADGFEVAAFMRNSEALRHVPIIMITSRSGDKHRERAASLGVDRYLIKPYQEDELLAEIAALLGDRA